MRLALMAAMLTGTAAAQNAEELGGIATDRLCAAAHLNELYLRANNCATPGLFPAAGCRRERDSMERVLAEVLSRDPDSDGAVIREQCAAGKFPATPPPPLPLPAAGFTDLKGASTMDLCRLWKQRNRNADIRAEIERRNEISASDWREIDAGRLYLGMPELAMVCSLGSYEDVHSSVDSWGVKQYVFGSRLYVYIEHGKITSWQN